MCKLPIHQINNLSRNFSVGPDGDRFLKLHQEEDKSTELGRRIPGTKMIGPSLNQYRITASNGAGGMGEVFWARDAPLPLARAIMSCSDLAIRQSVLARAPKS